jgi:hypothetical protein
MGVLVVEAWKAELVTLDARKRSGPSRSLRRLTDSRLASASAIARRAVPERRDGCHLSFAKTRSNRNFKKSGGGIGQEEDGLERKIELGTFEARSSETDQLRVPAASSRSRTRRTRS